MYGKGKLSLTLDARNSIVITLPSGETIDIQLSEKAAAGKKKCGLTINAAKTIKIHRATRRIGNEAK